MLLRKLSFLQQIASPANGGIAMTLLTRPVIAVSHFEGNTSNLETTIEGNSGNHKTTIEAQSFCFVVPPRNDGGKAIQQGEK
jgi:hypothetical protein